MLARCPAWRHIREPHAKALDLFLHQQGLDTSTPSGRALFQTVGVLAEFERAMSRERVLAGSLARKNKARVWAVDARRIPMLPRCLRLRLR